MCCKNRFYNVGSGENNIRLVYWCLCIDYFICCSEDGTRCRDHLARPTLHKIQFSPPIQWPMYWSSLFYHVPNCGWLWQSNHKTMKTVVRVRERINFSQIQHCQCICTNRSATATIQKYTLQQPQTKNCYKPTHMESFQLPSAKHKSSHVTTKLYYVTTVETVSK